ncbi:MAG TPA: carboxymuconolactone decarboxylase family protein, partial [Propionibacteriaceae bacterium]|nr:carboxymuconolactone decarboxylase family protein [Propionibacteriaceae bacterium]
FIRRGAPPTVSTELDEPSRAERADRADGSALMTLGRHRSAGVERQSLKWSTGISLKPMIPTGSTVSEIVLPLTFAAVLAIIFKICGHGRDQSNPWTAGLRSRGSWSIWGVLGRSAVRPSSRRVLGEGESALDYTEVLRLLAINDEHLAEECVTGFRSAKLDPKTLALVRLAALVAVGGAVPSYGAEADAAVGAGATAAEIVEVLVGVIPVVGLPSVVAAAPSLAMALGFDVTDDVEHRHGE